MEKAAWIIDIWLIGRSCKAAQLLSSFWRTKPVFHSASIPGKTWSCHPSPRPPQSVCSAGHVVTTVTADPQAAISLSSLQNWSITPHNGPNDQGLSDLKVSNKVVKSVNFKIWMSACNSSPSLEFAFTGLKLPEVGEVTQGNSPACRKLSAVHKAKTFRTTGIRTLVIKVSYKCHTSGS